MSKDPVRIALAVQRGLSAVCATCTKYWGARERGIEGDRCLSTDNCGGPLAGDDFHEYSGPMTDLSRWCFVCGDTPSHAVQVKHSVRRIGVCARHVKMFAELRAVGMEGQAPKVVVKAEGGGCLTVDDVLGPPKKSLIQAINEVEEYYAKKDGSE